MSMFCFQCEQTAKGEACTLKGVCGKEEHTAKAQDELTGKLIALSRVIRRRNAATRDSDHLVIDALFATLTNVNFDDDALKAYSDKADKLKNAIREACNNSGCTGEAFADYDMDQLWNAENEDIRSLKSLVLFALRGLAAYAHHARILGKEDLETYTFIYKALDLIGSPDASADELLATAMEAGEVNFACMKLLDEANTETFGTPVPTQVTTNIESGPFIVITGHDLLDLKQLLEQTDGKGINVYTHGEMLPAHAYPELKKYAHLKGNFGTAWQNQQKEFDAIPAPILFTTNCLMPPKESYADRVFTTSVVGYPEMVHIDGAEGTKDFTPVIEKALELGGYAEPQHQTGINGGDTLTTGFGHGAVLAAAGDVVDAVKAGAISHFFLVGGCDGARPGRNYYTEFVQETPEDSIILTLACGKYRFNDLDLGSIGGFPRIMDIGQCNDSYSAVTIALALADAFECGVNDLPLTLVLSWYEQKAVAILLSLLALGVKNIYIGPSLPAFISPNILNALVEGYGLTPISTPKEDLEKMLA